MARRRRNVPLTLRLMWRRLRSPEGRLAPLAALSIAVSVALATGLEMSSRSAQVQLEHTAEAIAGAAKVEVTAGGVGVPEAVLEQVRSTPGVLFASPLISTKLRLIDRAFVIDAVGVDLLAEEGVRSLSVSQRGVKVRDPLLLLTSSDSVVITQELLERLGVSESWERGDTVRIPVAREGRKSTLVVQGVLAAGGISSAFGGQVALMDVYALQALLGREGWFDRIDVVPAPGMPPAKLIEELAARLRGVASVHPSSARTREIDDAVDLIRTSALVIAAAGAVAACLLSYASTAQWVDRQRKQLAALRAVGMEAKRVQQGIFIEVSFLAVCGTVLGTFGGVFLAPTMLSTLSTLASAEGSERLTTLSVQPTTVLTAMAVGIVAAVAGGIAPAVRAGRRFSLDALDHELATIRDAHRWQLALGTSSFIFIAAWVAPAKEFVGGAGVRVGVMLVTGLAATFSLAPFLLAGLAYVLRPLRRMAPPLGHLTTRFYSARPLSFAIATTAISSLVGALSAVFLLIATVTSAVERWTLSGRNGGILILAEPLSDTTRVELLSKNTLDIIRAVPGVVAVDERYGRNSTTTVMFREREVDLYARTMRVVAEHGHIESVGRESQELARDLARGGIAVSTGFEKRFGIKPGQRIELDTPTGPESFEVMGVFEDFGGSSGSILMDLQTFDSHWTRTGASSAMIWTDGPPGSTVEAIRERVHESQDLFFVDSEEIAKYNRGITGLFTGVLRAIAGFVASLGGFAIAIVLFGAIAERRRDLSLLRAAGAEGRQIVSLVLIDAVAIAAISVGVGFGLGFACASPTTDILREQYGWVLDQEWFAVELPYLAIGALVSALLGAIGPARLAFRSVPSEAFAPE